MNIPVFHDDQHGTAIITAAGLINACHLTGRELGDIKVVVNGAGAAAIACTELIKAMGVRARPCHHVRPQGRDLQGPRRPRPVEVGARGRRPTRARWSEALVGADVFLGLSAAGALKPDMVMDMAPSPIIFAMANPDPEITPPEAKAARPDAIVATGRSDYPNQVNNVLGFPFIFRGALDVRATAINDEMKIAAAHALAELAREAVPEEVAAAYGGTATRFGPDYIIPAPFDPRLIEVVPCAVAQAAMDSGVAQKPIADMRAYRQQLRARLNPTASVLSLAYEAARSNPKRVLFAEARSPTCCAPRSRSRKAAMARRCWSAARTSTTSSPSSASTIREATKCSTAATRRWSGARSIIIYAKHQRHGLLPPRGRADGQPGPQHLRRGDARAGRGRRDDHRHDAPVQPVAAPGPHRDRRRAWRDPVRDQHRRRRATRRCSSPTLR